MIFLKPCAGASGDQVARAPYLAFWRGIANGAERRTLACSLLQFQELRLARWAWRRRRPSRASPGHACRRLAAHCRNHVAWRRAWRVLEHLQSGYFPQVPQPSPSGWLLHRPGCFESIFRILCWWEGGGSHLLLLRSPLYLCVRAGQGRQDWHRLAPAATDQRRRQAVLLEPARRKGCKHPEPERFPGTLWQSIFGRPEVDR